MPRQSNVKVFKSVPSEVAHIHRGVTTRAQRSVLRCGKYEARIVRAGLKASPHDLSQSIVAISFKITSSITARGKTFCAIVDTRVHKGARQLHQLARLAGFSNVGELLGSLPKLRGLPVRMTVWAFEFGKGIPLATRFAWAARDDWKGLPAVFDGKVAKHLDYELDACHIAQIFETGYVMERGKQVLRFAFEILQGWYFDQPFEIRFRLDDARPSIRDKAWEQLRHIAKALRLSGLPSLKDFEGKPFRINFIRDSWHLRDPWIEVLDFTCRSLNKCERQTLKA